MTNIVEFKIPPKPPEPKKPRPGLRKLLIAAGVIAAFAAAFAYFSLFGEQAPL